MQSVHHGDSIHQVSQRRGGGATGSWITSPVLKRPMQLHVPHHLLSLRSDEYLQLGPVNPNRLQRRHSQSYITSTIYTMPPRANQWYCMVLHD